MQIINAGDGLGSESENDVALAQAGALCRTAILHGEHHGPRLFREVIKAHDTAMNRNGLSGDPDIASADAAIAQQAASHEFCRVDSDGEANSLRGQDGGGVY